MKTKKGLSEVVSYVLLIGIAISLSFLVYAFAKNLVPVKVKECPESVSLSVENYSCDINLNEMGFRIKNTGLFNISGYMLRITNKTSGKAVYNLDIDPVPENMAPAEEKDYHVDYSYYNNITRIEIQPYIYDKERVYCKNSITKQEIEACD